MREAQPTFIPQTLLLGGIVVVTGIFWQLSRRLLTAVALRGESLEVPLSFYLVLGLLLAGSLAWAGSFYPAWQAWQPVLRSLALLLDGGALLSLGLGCWQLQKPLLPLAEGQASPLALPMVLLLSGTFGLLLLGTLIGLLALTGKGPPGRGSYSQYFRHFLSLLWLYLLLLFLLNL